MARSLRPTCAGRPVMESRFNATSSSGRMPVTHNAATMATAVAVSVSSPWRPDPRWPATAQQRLGRVLVADRAQRALGHPGLRDPAHRVSLKQLVVDELLEHPMPDTPARSTEASPWSEAQLANAAIIVRQSRPVSGRPDTGRPARPAIPSRSRRYAPSVFSERLAAPRPYGANVDEDGGDGCARRLAAVSGPSGIRDTEPCPTVRPAIGVAWGPPGRATPPGWPGRGSG